MFGGKETVTGLAVIVAGLATCRSAQAASSAMTTGAGLMNFWVGVSNHDAGGRALGIGMTGGAGLRYGDLTGMIDRTVRPNPKPTMTGYAVSATAMA